MNNTDNKKVVKAGLWYTIINFISKGAIFLTTPIFTRIMSETEIGSYANITSWFQVLVPLVTFDFCVSLNLARFDYKDSLDEYISSTLFYGTLITGIAYIIVVFNMDFFVKLFTISPYAIHIIFIYMLVYPALQMLQQKNLFLYRYKLSAVVTLVSLFSSVGISLFLTTFLQDSLFGRTIGYFGPLIVINVVIYIIFIIRGRRINFKYFKYAVLISFPMIWHSMATQVLSAGDRIIITRYVGEQANALYSVAYTCSMIVTVLWSSMNSAWSPWSIEKMDSNTTNEMKKASYYYILFFSFVVFVMMLVAPELLWIMGGKSYEPAKLCLPPIMIGLVCQFIYSLYINIEFYLKKQTRIAISTILAATINILLNVILVPRFGYVAAAYTTLLGYIILLLFHFLSVIVLGKKEWLDNKFNFLIVLVFLLTIPLMLFLYKYDIIRYVVFGLCIIALFIICLKNKEKIIALIKRFKGVSNEK